MTKDKTILPIQLQKVYSLISEAGETGIHIDALAIEMFGTKIGLNPEKIVHTRVLVCKLRKRISQFGMTISSAMVSHHYRVLKL